MLLIILVNNEKCKEIAKEGEISDYFCEYFVSCFDTIYPSVNKS